MEGVMVVFVKSFKYKSRKMDMKGIGESGIGVRVGRFKGL